MGANLRGFSTPEAPNTLDPLLVREQMDRMLAHHLFSRSKRYPPFLRYIIENALSGHSEHLKERTLGVEVLGRKPDYDTNQDPVVRSTASEIRQRIAQYYHESGHESEIRIELPAGSYIPEFHLPLDGHEPKLEARPVHAATTRFNAKIMAGSLAFAGISMALLIGAGARQNVVDQFWNPLLRGASPLLIIVSGCHTGPPPAITDNGTEPLGSAIPALRYGSSNQTGSRLCSMSTITFADALTLSRIVGIPQAKARPYQVKQASFVSYEDLRSEPVVLIGAFNNPWTMRLTSTMRYRFRHDSNADLGEIADNSDPSKRWSIPFQWQNLPENEMIKDYALITRLNDPTTEQMVVVAAGLGPYGTETAGEFLSSPKYLESLVAHAPLGWSKKNFQLVLETDVINDDPGQPHIIASQFW